MNKILVFLFILYFFMSCGDADSIDDPPNNWKPITREIRIKSIGTPGGLTACDPFDWSQAMNIRYKFIGSESGKLFGS